MDYFFLLRPTYFFNVWILICSGMYITQLMQKPESIWGLSLPLNSILFIIGMTLFCSGCFINWQISSKSEFKLQNKVYLIGSKLDIKKSTFAQYGLLVIGGLFILISDFLIIPFILMLTYFVTSLIRKKMVKPGLKELLFMSFIIFSSGAIHNYFKIGGTVKIENLFKVN